MKEELNAFIESALNEDIREGDHTSLACIPATAIGKAQLLVKEEGILAGMEVAQAIFEKVNTDIHFFPLMKDGESMTVGDVAFIVEGPSSAILTAERLVLNCMQRMSGIATKTHHIVKLLQRMVVIRIPYIIIFPKAFVIFIVIMINPLSFPIGVTFNSKMII